MGASDGAGGGQPLSGCTMRIAGGNISGGDESKRESKSGGKK